MPLLNKAISNSFSPLILIGLCRNLAEALVTKGLASVIRHRRDDDERALYYDQLLNAEAK